MAMASKKDTRICVIGAGPTGLCALRHLREKFCNIVAFEQMQQLGGLWVYSDKTGFDEDGVRVHSSMYKNLRYETKTIRSSKCNDAHVHEH